MIGALTRREWLKRASLSAAAPVVRFWDAAGLGPVPTLRPFVDPLPVPAVLRSIGRRDSVQHGVIGLTSYQVTMREIHCRLHRDLPPTRLWSYGPDALGPTFEAESGQGILVEWRNRLPRRHFMPVDYTLHGSGREVPESRAVVHLHGGRTPADSDGYPEHWRPTGQDQLFHYPNQQPATMLWYHDHAMGMGRLNLYAGLMGVYLLRDRVERDLHLPTGPFEVPLVLTDRILDAQGQLVYPVSDNPASPWVETVEGDTLLVNGRITPFCTVEPRQYRLRLLNAANGRFFRVSFADGLPFLLIGADQGLLPSAVSRSTLSIAPGERFDLLVDFSAHGGSAVVLQDGRMPLMQFQVKRGHSVQIPVPSLPLVPRLDPTSAVRNREMTLNQFDDPTGMAMVMLLNRTPWHMPVTETVTLNSTEIWSLVNLTEDTHPIHLHHVRFQILDRRPFDRDHYLLEHEEINYTGAAESPPAHESGWKDVVQCPAATVTRILISFEGFPGRYVWHCHIQEHEANDMMRPYDIVLPG